MKRKWQNWPVDSIGLIGLGGSIAYMAYMDWHPTATSAFLNLWPNMTTGLIGTWISIRVIEAFINKRADKENARFRMINHLRELKEITLNLTPDCYFFRIKELDNGLAGFKEQWPRREKYLDEEERKLCQEAWETLKKLLEAARKHRSALDHFEVKSDELEDVPFRVVEPLNKLKRHLVEGRIDPTSQILTDEADKLHTLAEQKSDSPKEFKQIHGLAHAFQDVVITRIGLGALQITAELQIEAARQNIIDEHR
jgi:hypothetical protein